MTTLCTLQNLSLSYPHKVIFKKAFFNIDHQNKVGVLGLNGHGKTSLFKIITQEVVPDTTVPPCLFDKSKGFSVMYIPQELPFDDHDLIEYYVLKFYPDCHAIYQELETIAETLNTTENYDEKLIERQIHLFEELDKKGANLILSKYQSYCRYFGFTNLNLKVKDLSGGEQRKLALGIGLSAPHELILWDEPTNHLDLETIELFEDELMDSQKTMMIISHDRYLLNNVCDHIVHIRNGAIESFVGTYNDYLEFLQEDEKRKMKELDRLSNYHRRETAWISRGARARRTKSKKRIADYGELSSQINSLKSEAKKSVELDLRSTERQTKILLDAKELTFEYKTKKIFNNLNFSIQKGDKISLIGKNGVGKSTLLKILNGELEATSGTLKRAHELKVGFFSQKRESLDPEMSPWVLLGDGNDFINTNTGEKRHVASYLENFLFTSEELKRPIKTFSGGEKNRLQLAKFMKDAADIWIFDEPTNDLDLETIGILEEELKNYQGALIVVGHDRAFIENATTKCWVLHEGGLDKFEGGFAQAAQFLEVLKLEEELKKLTPPTNSSKDKQDKLSYKEKKRLETIQQEIDQQEIVVSKIKKQLEAFDYANLSKDKKDELENLQTLEQKETHKLEVLFEEWTQLEAKNSLT